MFHVEVPEWLHRKKSFEMIDGEPVRTVKINEQQPLWFCKFLCVSLPFVLLLKKKNIKNLLFYSFMFVYFMLHICFFNI